MSTYTIGRVAERSGFSTSALRYYEQYDLLRPLGRSDAGYRLYDDSSLERLRFIARAKELCCMLEEIADLAELWEAAHCAPVQSRLHGLLTSKIDDAQRRSAELIQFTAQLQTVAAHLGDEPVDGPCGDGCACLGADPAIACALPAEAIPDRAEAWRDLVGYVRHREPVENDPGVRLLLDPEVPLDQLTRLAVAEQGCCALFSFAITVDHRGIALEVRAPVDAAELVTALFGAAA